MDISTYARKGSPNDEYEEIAAAQCEFTALSFIPWANSVALQPTLRGRCSSLGQRKDIWMVRSPVHGTGLGSDGLLPEFLSGSRFHEDVPVMAEKFDKATKLAFRDPTDPQYIKFGNVRDRDPDLGIRAGQLRLDGYVSLRGCD